MAIKTKILSTKLSLSRTCQNPIPLGIIVYRNTGIPGLWVQELDAGLWTLHSGSWTLDIERQTVDVKTLKFKTSDSFGNNGTLSITSFFQITLSNHLKV